MCHQHPGNLSAAQPRRYLCCNRAPGLDGCQLCDHSETSVPYRLTEDACTVSIVRYNAIRRPVTQSVVFDSQRNCYVVYRCDPDLSCTTSAFRALADDAADWR